MHANHSSDDDYEQSAREYERQMAHDRVLASERDAANDEWRGKWPNHCAACGGWGGATSHQSVPYGATSASFPVFDVCEALAATQCHRCGQHGLSEDSEGPCSFCDWNFDDGLE